jgi:histidine triad (HIT) family protein
MTTLFSRIISGEIPSHRITESEFSYAFLDIHPENPGHTLIVPKIEVDHWFEVPDEYYLDVMRLAKQIASALMQVTGAERIFTKIIGTDVPHFHLHLIPYQGTLLANEPLEHIATSIIHALEQQQKKD